MQHPLQEPLAKGGPLPGRPQPGPAAGGRVPGGIGALGHGRVGFGHRRRLGVSDATVVRTAQALGYSGLPELRRALAGQDDDLTLASGSTRLWPRPTGRAWPPQPIRSLASVDVLLQQVTGPVRSRGRVLEGAERLVWSGSGRPPLSPSTPSVLGSSAGPTVAGV